MHRHICCDFVYSLFYTCTNSKLDMTLVGNTNLHGIGLYLGDELLLASKSVVVASKSIFGGGFSQFGCMPCIPIHRGQE